MPDAPAREGKATTPARVLVVDDQASMAETIADGLADLGYDAVPANGGADAIARLDRETFDAIVTDLRMPDVDGLTLLAEARRRDRDRPVIVMTAYSAVDTAIESIRQGAYHYLTKPFKVAELGLFLGRALDESRLRREAASLRRALRDRWRAASIVGASPAMEEMFAMIERVAATNAPVLITGETGAGKGLVARALHGEGERANGHFVTVNCAALPENLLESELFGHVKGAFTGATANRSGLFEEASGGTLFLDEVAELAAALQAKLLHVLESGTVRAVGSNQERKVDVRVITATHRDLRKAVAEGAFREDLLYRIDVVTIDVPPLRHRREDIPLLVDRFVAQARARNANAVAERVSAAATEKILAYAWPGNVRELEHVIERAVILARGPEIEVADLPPILREERPATAAFSGAVLPLREVQRRYAQWAFEELGARKLLTAEKLGIDFKTLVKLLDGQ